MMKKIIVGILATLLVAVTCMFFTSCGGKTVEQLTNELGALLEGGGFASGSVLNLDKLDITEEKATEIFDKLEDNGIAINDEAKAYIYDIFVSKGNTKVQPDGTVKVTVPAPEDENADGYNVYHVKDSGAIESIPAEFKNGKIIFQTESFSYYVFVPTYNVGTMTITPTEILYLGTDNPAVCRIICDHKPIPRQEVTARAVNENATVVVQAEYNENINVFVGWFELMDEQIDPYHPLLKNEPVSTESTYVFEMPMDGYALYAVVAPLHAKVEFNYDVRVCSSATINGKEIVDGYAQIPMKIGNTYVITTEANEGYEFCVWSLFGPFGNEILIEGDTLEIVYDGTFSSITPIYNPEILGLEIEQNHFVYDPALLDEYESIGIAEFNAICKEGKDSENWNKEYVITGKIKRIENTTWGNMVLIDSVGNELHIYGLYDENGIRYGLMEDKPELGEVIAVHGAPYLYDGEPEMKKAYLLDSVSELPNFERLVVYVTTVEGRIELSSSEFTVDVGALDVTKPGEYAVTYTYKQDTTIQTTVTVEVLGSPVSFSAWVEGGTLLLDGVDIGADIYETFEDGVGKLTLTAVGDENTVFKGWYALNNESDTGEDILLSEDETYTFNISEDLGAYAIFEYIATEIYLDGANMGFDTYQGYTEIYLPVDGYEYNLNAIMVFAIVNGERELLEADEYTIDADGFDGKNPVMGEYEVVFTYKADTNLTATHLLRVLDEENLVSIGVSVDSGGRLTNGPQYYQYNKGTQIDLSVELRSEKDYEFLGWYSVVYGTSEATSSETLLSTDRNYTHTLNESVDIRAKIEPRVTYLEVDGYKGDVLRVHVQKFWLADEEQTVYACGALGKRVELTEDEYTVDYGGLDFANPEVGTYVITYTYVADTSIKLSITVIVWEEDFSFFAYVENGNAGQLLYEGALAQEAGGQFIKGESVTVTAVSIEGYTFEGWYKVISYDTHEEEVLISTEVEYTVTITEDVRIIAKFDAPVTELSLVGLMADENGRYVYETNAGMPVYLGAVELYAHSAMGSVLLSTEEYSIDYGGLDVEVPIAGSYTVTYIYKYNESTSLSISFIVKVMPQLYGVNIFSEMDRIEYNREVVPYVCGMFEEGTTITVKAIMPTEYEGRKVFAGWYSFDYHNCEWVLYDDNELLSFTVCENIKLRAKYEILIDEISMYFNCDPYTNGVIGHNLFNLFGSWDEEKGCFIVHTYLEIFEDSVYINDLTSIFMDMTIVGRNVNGNHVVIPYENLDIECEQVDENYYVMTVSYGAFTCVIDVWVMAR